MLSISVSSLKRLISLNGKVNVTVNCRWAREIKMADSTICFESATRVVSPHTRSISACRGGVFTRWNKGLPKVLLTTEVEPESTAAQTEGVEQGPLIKYRESGHLNVSEQQKSRSTSISLLEFYSKGTPSEVSCHRSSPAPYTTTVYRKERNHP